MSKLNIYACSGVDNVVSARKVAQEIEDAGWMRNETLRKYLGTSKDGGCAEYFLYIFIPENELAKYNSAIYKKRQGQLKTYAYVRELFVGYNYGTEEQMLDIIRGGIEKTFGAPVETVLYEIRIGKREGVGDLAAIATIITAIVSLIVAIVSGIIDYCKTVKVAKYTAPTMQEIEDSAPAATDITGGVKKKGLFFTALVGVGLMLIGTFKNRR